MPSCTFCLKNYARVEHLRRHVDAAHSATSVVEGLRKQHRCSYAGCGRSFVRSDALLRHKRSHQRRADQTASSVTPTPSVEKQQPQPQPQPQYMDASMSEGQMSSPSSSTVQARPPLNRQYDSSWSVRDQGMVSLADELPQGLPMEQFATQISPGQMRTDMVQPGTSYDSSTMSAMHDGSFQNSQQNHQQQQNQQQQQQHNHRQAQPFVVPDLNLMPGLNFVDGNVGPGGNMAEQFFSGLDWIFDDLTESSSEGAGGGGGGGMPEMPRDMRWHLDQPPEQSSRINLYSNDDIFGGSSTTLDTTETLNLLNLANAALFVPSVGQTRGGGVQSQSRTPTRGQQRQGEADGSEQQQAAANQQQQQQQPREDEDSWPQEFRPLRRKPPTIELSSFSLHVDGISPASGTGNRSSCDESMILLDDADESEMPPSRWVVNNETRQNVLHYLTHACRHPWSIYSFSSTPPPSFLTTSQIEKLVQLFFANFHPRVPLLHAATFDPATVPPILLLCVITIGLVFYPAEVSSSSSSSSSHAPLPPSSMPQIRKCTSILSVAFAELVRIGVMSAYEADQRGFADIFINQTWLLQQMFGIGSGDKRLYKIAERNRGGQVTAIRRLGLLYQPKESPSAYSFEPIVEEPHDMEDDEHSNAQIHAAWRAWVARESRLRLGWFAYLHDQLFSCYLDIAPMFRYTEVTASMPCHADLWSAENASLWMQRLRKSRESKRASSAAGGGGPSRDDAHPKGLISPLRQILQPANPALPLHLNHLEAYILAVTLYSIRWDSCKQRILFDDDSEGGGSAGGEKGGVFSIGAAAEKALQRLAEAAALPSRKHSSGSNAPLAMDVQLLHLLSRLHFAGPPVFFDKLRDAAGRSGISSFRRQEAVKWLQDWMASSPKSQSTIRRMLLASAQVYELVQRSVSLANGTNRMQSFVSTIGLFHAALCMWAFIQFTPASQIDDAAAAPSHDSLPRLPPLAISTLREVGVLNLNAKAPSPDALSEGEEENGAESGSNYDSSRKKLVEAWVQGRYISTEDDKVYLWPLSPLAVKIDGIGSLTPRGEGKGGGKRGSHVLERFAKLLSRLEWRLATSFRLILLHMARHATQ